jgi:hypothetical protein
VTNWTISTCSEQSLFASFIIFYKHIVTKKEPPTPPWLQYWRIYHHINAIPISYNSSYTTNQPCLLLDSRTILEFSKGEVNFGIAILRFVNVELLERVVFPNKGPNWVELLLAEESVPFWLGRGCCCAAPVPVEFVRPAGFGAAFGAVAAGVGFCPVT